MQEQDHEHEVEKEDAQNVKAFSEETVMALQNIFARLFSRDDSEVSTYFKDLINSAQEILVEDILTSPLILEVTSDDEVIRHAIFTCKYFSVVNEGTAVKAYAKPEQNTIILRDIPSSVTIEAIYNIFATAVGSDGSPCPPIVTARLDLNNCWFVTFASEEEAKLALHSIRESKIDDKPIKARLKTESSTKSFFSDKRGNFQNSPPNQMPADFSQSPGIGNNVPNYPAGVGPIPFPTNIPAGVANVVTMGPPGGMFLTGYPVPPPSFMPNFGMQGGALPMMGFPPPIMIPNHNTGKPMFMNPFTDAMQMQQMMQMGGPQLPPQMAPHNPMLFAPGGPYTIPNQTAQGYVDVNAVPQGVGYRPQQVQPTGGRDFNQRSHVGNNMNGNFINGSNNNRFMNSGNFNGSRNGNYNSPNNNQGGSRQNNYRNPRGNGNHGGGNYFYNRNNNYSSSSNNSGVGNSNDQVQGWQELGSSPSAELDGGSVGDNFTPNASMSSQSSSVEGKNNEVLNISTEGISTNEIRSPSNRSYGGDQGHRGAYDNNYSGGNANNYNRNTQHNNSSYNHNYNGANRVNGGDVTGSISNMSINRTDTDIRNTPGGGRGNFRPGSTNSSAYNNQRNKTGISNSKPPNNSNNSQPVLGESISKGGGDITGLASASFGRTASGSSADLKPVRRSGSNVGISESDGATLEENHSNAPRGNNVKSAGAAAGESRGKGAAANNPAGKDGKEAKEKDKERSREREREKGDRSGSKRGEKKDKKGGDADKAKKVPLPIAEFNLEADFPNLVENDPETNHGSSHVGPMRVASLGYANAVRKAVGSEATPLPPVSDGNAPIETTTASVSGPTTKSGGGGKAASKASIKPGNTTPSAAVAPAQSIASIVHTDDSSRDLSFGTNLDSSHRPEVTAAPEAAATATATAAHYLEPITFGAFSEPIQVTNTDSLHFGPVTSSVALVSDVKPTTSGGSGATNAGAADASVAGADHPQGDKAAAGSESISSLKSAAKKSFSEILRQQK
eukprot:gene28892-37907_t